MSAFYQQSIHLGFGLEAAAFRSNPCYFAGLVDDRVKSLARWITKRGGGVKQHQVLEAIAHGLNFENWFDYGRASAMLQDLDQSRPDRKFGDALFARFVGALALMAAVDDQDTPPEANLRAELERFAGRVGAELGLYPRLILDIFARDLGAADWNALTTRNPFQSATPYYQFSIYEPGNGSAPSGTFQESAACKQLAEELYELVDYVISRSDPVNELGELRQLVARYPAFLAAQEALASTLVEFAPELAQEATQVYKRCQLAAEAIIPKHFEGEISWGSHSNRWYLNVLFGQARMLALDGHTRPAQRIAKRLLRLNPNDNQGVRFLLPALHLANLQMPSALATASRVSKNGLANAKLVHGLILLADNQVPAGLERCLHALFELPLIAPLILENSCPDYQGEARWHRGVIPDIVLLWDTLDVLYNVEPLLFDTLQEVFGDASVKEAEDSLEKLYLKANSFAPGDAGRVSAFESWRIEVANRAKLLSAELSPAPQGRPL